MSDRWYYAREGRQQGPVQRDALADLVASQALSRDDLVWRDGMESWLPVAKVPELAEVVQVAIAAPPPPPLPAVLTSVSASAAGAMPVAASSWQRRVQGARSAPLSFEALASLARAGMVRREDLVARVGSEDWVQAGKLAGLFEPGAAPSSSPVPSMPPVPDVSRLADVRGMNKWLYFAGVLGPLVMGGALYSVLLDVGTVESERIVLGVIVMLFAASCGVLLTFVYRIWDAIQDGQVQTRPGAAAGFLLLPLFNAYWVFRVFPGYVREFNAFATRHGLRVRRLKLWMHLALPIVVLVLSGVAVGAEDLPEYTRQVLVLVGLGLLAGVLAVTCDAVQELSEHEPLARPAQAPPAVPKGA